jgi:hypothetical protein
MKNISGIEVAAILGGLLVVAVIYVSLQGEGQ